MDLENEKKTKYVRGISEFHLAFTIFLKMFIALVL
jgi:hypothetical protein